jgi:hypothetical protein
MERPNFNNLEKEIQQVEETLKRLDKNILALRIAKAKLEKSIPMDAEVKVNFADIKKEFEEKFVLKAGAKITFTALGGDTYLEEITDTDAMLNLRPEVIWEWFEQKLKDVSKISE